MAKVFISHSSEDKEFVRRLASDLRSLGHEPWLDEWEIGVGECIVSAVQSALTTCDYVAVVLTRASVASSWVGREWKTKYWSEIDAGRVQVLPLLAETCGIPELLRTKRYADFRDNYALGLVQLTSALSPTVPAQTVPAQSEALHHSAQDARVSALISKVQSRQSPLAECVAESLVLAQALNAADLEEFCRLELAGYRERKDGEAPAYRTVEGFLAPRARINANYMGWSGPGSALQHMRENTEEFFPRKIMISEPLSKLEAGIAPRSSKNLVASINLTFGDVLPSAQNPSAPLICYFDPNSYEMLVENVRSELTLLG